VTVVDAIRVGYWFERALRVERYGVVVELVRK
jgi:hypothetical protein